MRLFNKFYALCVLAVCSILLSGWLLASQESYRRWFPTHDFHATEGFDRRLVVFGDSWSDNNASSPLQGSVWTDWLCSMFSCQHENLAQATKVYKGRYTGAVVDNKELLGGSLLSLYESPPRDFKGQVQQWAAAEAEVVQHLTDNEDVIRHRQNGTIFVVAFGAWDLWNLIDEDYDTATKSIDRSTTVILEQLSALSHGWAKGGLKVILTLAPDVTFLPAFRYTTQDGQVGRHKNAVQLTDYWNVRLRDAAQDWNDGVIYLFDTNAFLADLIRDRQLFAAGIEEDSGLGKNLDPGWENVDDSCIVENSQQQVMTSGRPQCDDPEKYLFWNEMHLGPAAHRLLGTEVFHGIEDLWLK